MTDQLESTVPGEPQPEVSEEKEYTSESIQVLEGLEAIRKRPGMYVGGTGLGALHHLVYECVDNAIDEVMAGFASQITVRLGVDGKFPDTVATPSVLLQLAPGQSVKDRLCQILLNRHAFVAREN